MMQINIKKNRHIIYSAEIYSILSEYQKHFTE